jgi:hypothetical protein
VEGEDTLPSAPKSNATISAFFAARSTLLCCKRNGPRPSASPFSGSSKLDSLETALTDDLVAFLRKLLYDENLVQEEVLLGPIVQAVGAIEEDRIDEAVEKFAGLLRKAVKDAKAQHGKSKRVRVFLRLQDQMGDLPFFPGT